MSAETDFAAALVREKNARITQLEADRVVHAELADACQSLIDVIDGVDGDEEYTKEEWAALGSAKLHAEDSIRSILARIRGEAAAENCQAPGCDNLTDRGICDDCDQWVSDEVARIQGDASGSGGVS